MQGDLFASPAGPAVAVRADIVDATEEAALIAAIDATEPTPFRFQGWLGKRLTTSFGWRYDFERGTMTRGARRADARFPAGGA